jgi:hypothetical protein
MIWVITKNNYGDQTYVDCVKATYVKARAYIDEKNYGQQEWFYQIWEKEIE